MSTSKTCGRCGETKPVSAFYRHRRTKDGLRWSCKTCEAEYQRTYRRKHPEMKRLYVKPRRALRKGAQGHHTLAEWRQLCEAYGHKCLCCGVSGVPLTEDHVIPLSLGGSDSIDNLRTLGVTCNSMKGETIADYRGGYAVVDKNLDRVTVAEAAQRLGVKEQAIRKRIGRGTLLHDKGEDGRVYVYIDAEAEDKVQGTDTRADTYLEALVDSLQDQNRFLREELVRRDAILMNMTETMRQLTAPSAPEESTRVSETGTESSAEGAAPPPSGGGPQTREGLFPKEEPERRGFRSSLFGG